MDMVGTCAVTISKQWFGNTLPSAASIITEWEESNTFVQLYSKHKTGLIEN